MVRLELAQIKFGLVEGQIRIRLKLISSWLNRLELNPVFLKARLVFLQNKVTVRGKLGQDYLKFSQGCLKVRLGFV